MTNAYRACATISAVLAASASFYDGALRPKPILASDRYAAARAAAARLPVYSSAGGRAVSDGESASLPRAISNSRRLLVPDPLDTAAAFYLLPDGTVLRANDETGSEEDFGRPLADPAIAVATATRVGALYVLTTQNEFYEKQPDEDWTHAGRPEAAEPGVEVRLLPHPHQPTMVLAGGKGLHAYDAGTRIWTDVQLPQQGSPMTALAVSHTGTIWVGFSNGCVAVGKQTTESFRPAEVAWSSSCSAAGNIAAFAFDVDHPERVIAAHVGESKSLSVLRISEDAGETWRDVHPVFARELPDAPLRGLASDDNTLYAITSVGIFVTTDLGTTWMAEAGTVGRETERFIPVADQGRLRFYIAGATNRVEAIDNSANGCRFVLYDGSTVENYMSIGAGSGSHWRTVGLPYGGSRTNCHFIPAFCKKGFLTIRIYNRNGGTSKAGDVYSRVLFSIDDNRTGSRRARGLVIDYNERIPQASQMPVAIVQAPSGSSTACQLARYTDVDNPHPRGTQGILNFTVRDTNPSCSRTFDLSVIACGMVSDSNLSTADRTVSLSQSVTRAAANRGAASTRSEPRGAVCHDTPAGGSCPD